MPLGHVSKSKVNMRVKVETQTVSRGDVPLRLSTVGADVKCQI